MPPHASYQAPSDDLIDEMHSSIEVETNAMGNGKIIVSKIVVYEPISRNLSLFDDDEFEDDIVVAQRNEQDLYERQEYDFYGEMSDNFMNACGVCSTEDPKTKMPRKSALKKTPNSSNNSERSVAFNSLKIREYGLTLGDHPSASSGPPMTLDWTPTGEEKVISVDQYERGRQPRRSRKALRMSYQTREAVLEEQGFTMDQVMKAWEESLKIRKQRHETITQSPLSMKMEEACQSAARKFWRTVTLDF